MSEQAYPGHLQVVRVQPPESPPGPIDPRFRLVLIAMRQACFIVGDAISDYLSMPRRKTEYERTER